MAESEVFWLGGKPGPKQRDQQLADSDTFVAAIRETCESLGCDYGRLISAQGDYGTWLVEFSREGKKQRILWNGKDEILVLQQERPNGGWDEPRRCSVTDQGRAGFVAGVTKILADDTA